MEKLTLDGVQHVNAHQPATRCQLNSQPGNYQDLPITCRQVKDMLTWRDSKGPRKERLTACTTNRAGSYEDKNLQLEDS
jgi:hypothetical protein